MPLATDAGCPAGLDLSNWRTAPFSQWAFRNVGAVVPTAEIEAALDSPWALSKAPASLDGFRLPGARGVFLSLQDVLDATATDALVILRDGQVVHEAYAHGNTPHTQHILMSATKAVVGLMAEMLQARGELDLDALVSDLVPEVAATAYRGATLRHLLDMRAGVVLDESRQRAYEAATGWDPVAPGRPTQGLHAFFETLTAPQAQHGGPFRYVSANTDLLGWALERATGRTVAELVSDLLWKPMGAECPAAITLDRDGAPRCTGGLCATARDFARIGQLVVDGGRRNLAQVVPASVVDGITEGGDHDAWKNGEWGSVFSFAGARMRYRSGWYVVDDDPRTLFAMGIHGQNLFVDRANRIVVAKLSSQGSPIDYQAVPLTHRAVAEIRRCLVANRALLHGSAGWTR